MSNSWGDFFKGIAAIVIAVVGGLGLIAGIALLYALPVMLIWNAVIPDVTNNTLTPLSFGQALGVAILSALLVKTSVSKK